MPALFTSMCSPPISAMVRATASSASCTDVTSTTCVITQSSPPISRRSLDDCPSHSGFTSIIDTRAPARTRASVIFRPSPIGLAAPGNYRNLAVKGPFLHHSLLQGKCAGRLGPAMAMLK